MSPRWGEMDQAKADASDDLFTTETAGLPEVLGPDVTRLADGDRLDLRIGPVRKNIDGAELRMLAYNGSIPGPTLQVDQGSEITVQVRNDGDVEATVHWHGLRLENQYDGVPDETRFSGQAAAGEVVRLYVVNTANTRIFNFAIRGARAKLVGGDSGRYERETITGEVLLAPSERAVIDVLFDTPGQVRLEHRTPDHVYDLGGFTVTDGAPGAAAGAFEQLRTDPELTAEHQAIGHDIERPPDKVLEFYSP